MERVLHLVGFAPLLLLLLVLGSLVATDSAAAAGQRRVARKTLIVGGKLVAEGGAAWQVAIMKKRKLMCGGSLVRNNVVLTAAECVKDLEPADILVRAGSLKFKNGGQLRKVRETIYHPEYDGKMHGYNVALLHLMRPLNVTTDTVRRVKLPEDSAELPSAISVYGWGMSHRQQNTTITKNLRFSKSKVYSARKCEQYLDEGDLSDNVFCSGDRTKRFDVCNDDLGSPAIAEGGVQFGVVVEGGACSDTQTTIFASVQAHKTWIDETLREFKSSEIKKKVPQISNEEA